MWDRSNFNTGNEYRASSKLLTQMSVVYENVWKVCLRAGVFAGTEPIHKRHQIVENRSAATIHTYDVYDSVEFFISFEILHKCIRININWPLNEISISDLISRRFDLSSFETNSNSYTHTHTHKMLLFRNNNVKY